MCVRVGVWPRAGAAAVPGCGGASAHHSAPRGNGAGFPLSLRFASFFPSTYTDTYTDALRFSLLSLRVSPFSSSPPPQCNLLCLLAISVLTYSHHCPSSNAARRRRSQVGGEVCLLADYRETIASIFDHLRASEPKGLIEVTLVSADSLYGADITGTSDPYVEARMSADVRGRAAHGNGHGHGRTGGGAQYRSCTRWKTLNPVWGETFRLLVHDPSGQALRLRVMDEDLCSGDDTLGIAVLPMKARCDLSMRPSLCNGV